MSEELKQVRTPLPDLGCVCAGLRRAARLVTQLYSEEMSGEIEPAQFALLSVLSKMPGASQTPIGKALGMDKTTISRNLRVLVKKGWIRITAKADRRERGYELTSTGNKLLATNRAGWERAQTKLRDALQPGEWETILNAFDRVAEAARSATSRQDRIA